MTTSEKRCGTCRLLATPNGGRVLARGGHWYECTAPMRRRPESVVAGLRTLVTPKHGATCPAWEPKEEQ